MSISLTMPLMMLLAACSATDGKENASGESANTGGTAAAATPVIAMTKPEYHRLGELASCSFKEQESDDWCAGYSNVDFDTASGVVIAKLLLAFDSTQSWSGTGGVVEHAGKDPMKPAYHQIRVNSQAERMPFKDLKASEVILARFEVPAPTGVDSRYGFTFDSKLTNYYYLVVDKHTPQPRNELNSGKQLADWAVYGVTVGSNPTAMRIGDKSKVGAFRYCKNVHKWSDSRGGAAFLTCESANRFMALGEKLYGIADVNDVYYGVEAGLRENKVKRPYSMADIQKQLQYALGTAGSALFNKLEPDLRAKIEQLVFDMIEELPGNPAWMHCGAGCCTADNG